MLYISQNFYVLVSTGVDGQLFCTWNLICLISGKSVGCVCVSVCMWKKKRGEREFCRCRLVV